jgi:hypothetical protein
MGKRSDFERKARDFYPTPPEAVTPLLSHLRLSSRFIEPCAGNGALVDALSAAGHHCVWESDIAPQRPMYEADACSLRYAPADYIITNPPWDRRSLHPMIEWMSDQLPTWLLFDADWVHTRQAVPLLPRLVKIVAVGRIKWIPDSPFTGKDNCAWHLFDKPSEVPAAFYGRAA